MSAVVQFPYFIMSPSVVPKRTQSSPPGRHPAEGQPRESHNHMEVNQPPDEVVGHNNNLMMQQSRICVPFPIAYGINLAGILPNPQQPLPREVQDHGKRGRVLKLALETDLGDYIHRLIALAEPAYQSGNPNYALYTQLLTDLNEFHGLQVATPALGQYPPQWGPVRGCMSEAAMAVVMHALSYYQWNGDTDFRNKYTFGLILGHVAGAPSRLLAELKAALRGRAHHPNVDEILEHAILDGAFLIWREIGFPHHMLSLFSQAFYQKEVISEDGAVTWAQQQPHNSRSERDMRSFVAMLRSDSHGALDTSHHSNSSSKANSSLGSLSGHSDGQPSTPSRAARRGNRHGRTPPSSGGATSPNTSPCSSIGHNSPGDKTPSPSANPRTRGPQDYEEEVVGGEPRSIQYDTQPQRFQKERRGRTHRRGGGRHFKQANRAQETA